MLNVNIYFSHVWQLYIKLFWDLLVSHILLYIKSSTPYRETSLKSTQRFPSYTHVYECCNKYRSSLQFIDVVFFKDTPICLNISTKISLTNSGWFFETWKLLTLKFLLSKDIHTRFTTNMKNLINKNNEIMRSYLKVVWYFTGDICEPIPLIEKKKIMSIHCL